MGTGNVSVFLAPNTQDEDGCTTPRLRATLLAMSTHPAQATFDAQTRARQEAFLPLYAQLGNVTEAAATLGLTSECAYRWVREDVQGFKARFELAHRAYGDYLRSLARQRLANPSGHVGGDILLIAGIAAHGNPEWRIERGQQQGVTKVQVTQIIINAPGQPRQVVEAQVVDVPSLELPEVT